MEQVPNILDLALLAVMIFFMIRALFRGLVREVMGLVGVVVAIMISAATYQPVGNFLRRVSGEPSGWWDAVAFAAALVVVLAFFVYLGAGLSKLIHKGPFSGLDRLLGAGVGLVKGGLVCYLLLNLLLLLMPFKMLTDPQAGPPEMLTRSLVAPYVIRSGRYIMDLVPDTWTHDLQERSGLFHKSSPPSAPARPGPGR